MTFNDADLKRLKEKLSRLNGFYIRLNEGDPISVDALLARLDAAEKVCVRVDTEAWVNVTEDLKVWRKTAGK